MKLIKPLPNRKETLKNLSKTLSKLIHQLFPHPLEISAKRKTYQLCSNPWLTVVTPLYNHYVVKITNSNTYKVRIND